MFNKSKIFILLSGLLIFNFSLYGFTSNSHKMLTKGAIYNSLVDSKYKKLFTFLSQNNGKYIDTIISSCAEPDRLPLTDDEIKANTSLCNYNFNGWIHSKIDELVSNIAGDLPAIVSDELHTAVEQNLKAHTAAKNLTNEDMLRIATQHTYVSHPGLTTHTVAILFGEITIAPYAAHAEYEMAIDALHGKKFSQATEVERCESLRRLGRLLHYIEDITIPHHCEIAGNYYDLYRGITDSNLNLDSAKFSSSQRQLEEFHMINNYSFDDVTKKFNRIGDNTGKLGKIKWRYSEIDTTIYMDCGIKYQDKHLITYERDGFENNNALIFKGNYYQTDVKDVVINLRNMIKSSQLMDFCDGIKRYNFYKSVILLKFDSNIFPGLVNLQFFNQTMPNHLSRQYDRQIQHQENILCCFGIGMSSFTNTTELSVNDNLLYVSDQIVPLAITEAAKIITKYFYEVEGIQIDRDMTPIVNLLLND